MPDQPTPDQQSSGQPFTVLVVCTGNVCRSPLAEQLLLSALAKAPALAGEVVIHSAGTEAPVGAPMSPPSAAISVREGSNPEGHVARQITAEMVREADLILVATRGHRSDVARIVPRAARRLFTIREFGRFADAVLQSEPGIATSADDLRGLVDQAVALRGYLPAHDPELDDIIDPIGRSERTYERMAGELVPAVRAVAGLLFR